MTDVVHSFPADQSDHVRLILSHPVGQTQAGAIVTAACDEVEQSIMLHGQRELDVLDGATVTFPDGTVYTPDAPADPDPVK